MQKCACGNSDSVKFRRYLDNEDDGDLLGVACTPCGQEWLREEYLSTEGQRKLVFGDLELKEHVNEPHEVQASLQVNGSRTKIGRNDFHCLKAAEHITWHRPYIIWHHGIILDIDIHGRRLQVAHWSSQDDKNSDKIKICTQWLDVDEQLGDLFRIDYPAEVIEKNPPNLVLARAASRICETGYGLLNNNCEGFAAFCKTGISESCQTNWFWGKLKEVGGTAVGQFAKTVAKTVCTGVKEAAKAGATAASEITVQEAVKNVGKLGIAETVETVKHASNWVGAGIVIAIEGGFCIWDVSKIYEKRKNGSLSRKDFIESTAQRVMEAICGAGFAVAGSLLGEFLGGAAGAALGSVIPVVGTVAGATVGVFIGSIIGGVVGALGGKILGSLIGPFVGKAIVHFIKRDDRAVESVEHLTEGDHVVFYRWLLHPRHHAIVVETDSVRNKIRIVHNTRRCGIVEEWVNFVHPVYKVIYNGDECHISNDVIARARSKLGDNNYSLITNNCKDFARWCKEKNTT